MRRPDVGRTHQIVNIRNRTLLLLRYLFTLIVPLNVLNQTSSCRSCGCMWPYLRFRMALCATGELVPRLLFLHGAVVDIDHATPADAQVYGRPYAP